MWRKVTRRQGHRKPEKEVESPSDVESTQEINTKWKEEPWVRKRKRNLFAPTTARLGIQSIAWIDISS
jgi:hypothetical protein